MLFKIQISAEINKEKDGHPSLSKPVALNSNKAALCYVTSTSLSDDYLEEQEHSDLQCTGPLSVLSALEGTRTLLESLCSALISCTLIKR